MKIKSRVRCKHRTPDNFPLRIRVRGKLKSNGSSVTVCLLPDYAGIPNQTLRNHDSTVQLQAYLSGFFLREKKKKGYQVKTLLFFFFFLLLFNIPW